MNKHLLWIIVALCSGCNSVLNEHDYLKKVSENLNEIKSASYVSTQFGSIPGDTTTFSEPMMRNYKIFINPSA